MTDFYDRLETRSPDERHREQDAALGAILRAISVASPDWLAAAAGVKGQDDLPDLPVLRKFDLAAMQKAKPPFGGIEVKNVAHIFQSPGPIYEPGGIARDWWRIGRFLHALGIGPGDIVQNCFSYHLTPAGLIFENGAQAVGAKVIPAGTGQTELQVLAAHDIGATAYAGTPDYLKVILDKADEIGLDLKLTRAGVGGGALFPQLRQDYADRGILCLQNYATADLGNIAYETEAQDGMVVDEGVIPTAPRFDSRGFPRAA